MVHRALTFGAVASAYEQYRPSYPDRVADEVLTYVAGPIRNALEIGAGTGEATRLFAARGIAVTATDPDAAMLAELRRHVPAHVRTLRAALEELEELEGLEPAPTYDLVYAAAALHWTDPERRWVRIAALLARCGVFASFGGAFRLADPSVAKAVEQARAPWLVDDEVPPQDETTEGSPMHWPGTELERSHLFTDVRQTSIERRMTIAAGDFVGYLSTVSAYLELPERDRGDVLDHVHAVLPPTVAVVADIDLHLAHLRS